MYMYSARHKYVVGAKILDILEISFLLIVSTYQLVVFFLLSRTVVSTTGTNYKLVGAIPSIFATKTLMSGTVHYHV